ncbi:hypothetical protein [Mycetocola zhujimingii]|uniref:Hpt domain-containing protein n=1 Tax=Mycetocola zhujimingii TaxID=2079792 RepID=A0A2U1TB92_9MICO|nr:hypothetical protein [Mycetocola zhujimingii]AWB87380.1 hypothetical protein C3E77_12655 [Mycetocola zhujimingii]PWC06158.1 hypothetical protein DF223_11060 [Mycetocola zhujimingii]
MLFPPNDHRAQSPHAVSLASHLPLIDEGPLNDLLAALESDMAAVVSFVTAFIEQWPERFRRIVETIGACDSIGAVTAVLSLNVSSRIIGATALTAMSTELETVVRQGDFDAGRCHLGALEVMGSQTLRALSSLRYGTELAVA